MKQLKENHQGLFKWLIINWKQIVETIKRESPRSVQMSKWNYLFATFYIFYIFVQTLVHNNTDAVIPLYNLFYFYNISKVSTSSSSFYHFGKHSRIMNLFALSRMRPDILLVSTILENFRINKLFALCRMRPHVQPSIALISSHCWIFLKIIFSYASPKLCPPTYSLTDRGKV